MAVDFASAELLTFDCYGTLIDWETGIRGALRPLLDGHGVAISDDRLAELYASCEARAEHGPFAPYREIQARVVDELGRELGFAPSGEERTALSRSLPDWPPFADTVDALRRLQTRFRLGILSNVDDDLFAGTAIRLGVDFSLVVTAQQVSSYKPARGHFEALLAREDVTTERLVHCAQSPFHDLVPARKMGIASVWVDRTGCGGAGLSLPVEERGDLVLPSLAALADAAGV